LVFAALVFSSAAFFGGLAIFGQPKGFLPKLENDSNFDVIDNISSQSKEAIFVGGAGTFIKITPKYLAHETSYNISRVGGTDKKLVVLTFDDGPDPAYTPVILEILKKENIPGAFFLIGEQVLKYPQIAKTIVSQGYEVGNHTFSHPETDLDKPSDQVRIEYELNFSQNAIVSATGVKTKLFRSPYWGAEDKISMNSLVLATFALDKGYLMSSPTLDSFDYREETVEKIIQNSTSTASRPIVLLFHDGGGDRGKTVAALPAIINFYKGQGYHFEKLSTLAGQPTMVQPSVFEDVTSNISVLGYKFLKGFPRFLNPIFLFGLFFTLVYSGSIVLLSLLEIRRNARLKKALAGSYQPAVTILVPAYNEERVIAKTIQSILNSDYPKLKLFVIDDGSTDRTFTIAKVFERDSRVKVLHKENGGKFSALNLGLKMVKTPVYIALDSDTQILRDTVSRLVRFFQKESVGAVAGNVKVGNRGSLLGIMQAIEYIMSLNLERNAYSFLNSILVVPGALGAWRTSVVKRVGGYLSNTLTEDAELTIRILRGGYKIVYDKDSIAYTEAPVGIGALIKQRLRWTFGIFQTLFAHRDLIFKRNQKFLGFVVLPFTAFIQVPIMLLTPLMDILAIYFLFFVSAKMVINYFVLYLTIRIVLGITAFVVSRESPWLLIFMPLQRIYYQPILYAALYQAILRVLRGSGLTWRKVEHYGSVTVRY